MFGPFRGDSKKSTRKSLAYDTEKRRLFWSILDMCLVLSEVLLASRLGRNRQRESKAM